MLSGQGEHIGPIAFTSAIDDHPDNAHRLCGLDENGSVRSQSGVLEMIMGVEEAKQVAQNVNQ